ncbi:YtxH domain-containing protein [Dyadobacter sp. BHUBP1]|uniref:YtxH domain-containing protein n=1 Tax=Dyadobacter sp. BHUBP1 TaxID=3424178 RepID=UPI003D333DE8
MKYTRIALAIALAAAAGFTAGVLTAPDKGKRTRRKLSDAALDLIEDLEQNCQDTLEDLKVKAEKEYRKMAQGCGSMCRKEDQQREAPAANTVA